MKIYIIFYSVQDVIMGGVIIEPDRFAHQLSGAAQLEGVSESEDRGVARVSEQCKHEMDRLKQWPTRI